MTDNMAGMADIDQLTKQYRDARAKLGLTVALVSEEQQAAVDRHLPNLRALTLKLDESYTALVMAIRENKALFEKPRTRILHGIKVGFAKGKGSMSWEDDAHVVRLIRKHMEQEAERLIATTEKPSKQALASLTGAELKKIGVTLDEAGDRVVVKTPDNAIEKMVDALLKASQGDYAEPEESE